ncbi:MaoC family dehydratase [Denitratisoma oestradiolicum]|uniref:(R)-specific enoyl-CoA hydratase n=1 Tax=Denitratisoma oestradiolicum TaxID=311182 RepID=A0A6S6Y0L3_9PROT|nr:MaoC family dehydratase [Denitratisoma oestradiolicum]TWO80762.1 (R)-hydratase [Denitratisoma oestradiolicum]CAB1370928.1 (R)-specific enoyl-CoA hydratase [Denitratisoma oestradiolicum]
MHPIQERFVEDLAVGMTASISKTITETDIILFSGVSTDVNPIHIDEEYAAATIFKGRVAHGMLSASLISAVLANKLPGPGTIYMAQNARFRSPVRPEDTVTATVTIKEVLVEKKRVILDTTCRVGDRVVIEGEATVMFPSRKD